MNGLPLLSHPPPENRDSDASACRKCSKEFNFLFTRSKRCNHCGYAYCTSCADFQALMPRVGPETGYEALPVCAYCMEMLTITASSKNKLRTLPLAKLKSYMKAYNIGTGGAVLEKDDLVDAILRAKGSDGCLLPIYEAYYRKNSIPQKYSERPRTRSFFSRSARQETPTSSPQPQQQQYAPPPGPPPRPRAEPPPQHHQHQHHPGASLPQMPFPQPSHFVPPASPPYHPYTPPTYGPTNNFRPSTSQSNIHARQPRPYPTGNHPHTRPPPPPPPPPRPRSAAPTVPTTPVAPPPVPTLDVLLQKSPDEIAHLSISALKSILFNNRVNSSSGVLEKQDLVRKVVALVADERRDRRIKEREEREEAERMHWAKIERERQEEERKAERERELMDGHEARGSTGGDMRNNEITDEPKSKLASSPLPSFQHTEQTQDGLCVVCQDEHANMAIIDCGHLALCKGCSEIVMKTTRECPLCRTRIVTEQRLLRIFKA